MNSQKVLYNKVGGDESYTPKMGVTPILKYIEQYKETNNLPLLIVWCPFDTLESEFVIEISKLKGVFVVASHLENEQDFFTYQPPEWHIIVSNPPFKNKRLFFERALELGKPFALLMTLACFNDK